MRKLMDEKLWWAIKTLLKGGSSQKEAAELFKVSASTVTYVDRSESFEEYNQMRAAVHAKYTEKAPEKPSEAPVQVVEHRQNITIQATHYMMEELKKQNELLELISRKLGYIVDQLT